MKLTTLMIVALAAVTLAACSDNKAEPTDRMPAQTDSMGPMTHADPMTPADPAMADPAAPAGMVPPPVNHPAAMDPAATSPATGTLPTPQL